MKTRSGFVSNSSSSSFVVAASLPIDSCSHCGRKSVTPEDVEMGGGRYSSDEIRVKVKTIEEAEAFFREHFELDDDPEYAEDGDQERFDEAMAKTREAVKEGYNCIIDISVPYGDSSYELLKKILKVKVIYSFN